MRSCERYFSQVLKLLLGLLFLGAVISSAPAHAAVLAGTINFSGAYGAAVVENYNGLIFNSGSGWVYDNAFGSVSITPNAGTSSDPGIVKVATAGDLFNATSVKVVGYGSDASVTVAAYRSGGPVGTPQVLSTGGASLQAFSLTGMTEIDELRFYNSDGYLSVADLAVTPYVSVPGAPTGVSATAGNGSASVSFTAPASNGGASITGYTVTSSPGGITATGSSSPITVSGLTNGTAYTFTVTATNSAGTGATSAVSNSVTPGLSQTITFTNPGAQSFGTTPNLSATASSGLARDFQLQHHRRLYDHDGWSPELRDGGHLHDQRGSGWKRQLSRRDDGEPQLFRERGRARRPDDRHRDGRQRSGFGELHRASIERRRDDHQLYGHVQPWGLHGHGGDESDRGDGAHERYGLYVHCHGDELGWDRGGFGGVNQCDA